MVVDNPGLYGGIKLIVRKLTKFPMSEYEETTRNPSKENMIKFIFFLIVESLNDSKMIIPKTK